MKLDEGGVGSSIKLADSFVWLKTVRIFSNGIPIGSQSDQSENNIENIPESAA